MKFWSGSSDRSTDSAVGVDCWGWSRGWSRGLIEGLIEGLAEGLLHLWLDLVGNSSCWFDRDVADAFDEVIAGASDEGIAGESNSSSFGHSVQRCKTLHSAYATLIVLYFCTQTPRCFKKSRNSRMWLLETDLNSLSVQYWCSFSLSSQNLNSNWSCFHSSWPC